MPEIPRQWIDGVCGLSGESELIELPGGIIYDPMTGCVSVDEIEWEQPDIMALLLDSIRYRWLRERDLDTIYKGGVSVGMMPQKIVLNGADLDFEVDTAMALESAPNAIAQGREPGLSGEASLGAEG